MTCCLLVTLRFRPSRLLAIRLGRHWPAWLTAIAAVELVAAWLLVRTLAGLSAGPTSPVMPQMASMGASPSRAATATALGLVLAASLVGSAALRAEAMRREAYTSFVCFAVAVLPVVRGAAAHSHLVFMGQLMLLLVIAPALFASALVRAARCPSGLALLAAGVYLVVLYAWHLPGAHAAAMSDPGWEWVLVASSVAAGVTFWASARSRLPALLAVGVGSGLLGLALLIGPQPLFAMAPSQLGSSQLGSSPLGLSPLSDQRLAGLLMMAVDLLVLVPLAARAADAAPERRFATV